MKKIFGLFFLIVLCLMILPNVSMAEAAVSSPVIINARVLPTVWYSTLTVNDGDSIKIYGAIQNNSGVNFKGSAIFYVDDKEISKGAFSSMADSLIDVSANWVALPGTHKVQVSVTTDLPASKSLVSYSSDKVDVSITRKIDLEAVQTTAINTANNILAGVNSLADSLATRIEDYKTPEDSTSTSSLKGIATGSNSDKTNSTVTSSIKKKGSVLGASTEVSNDSASVGVAGMSLNMGSFFNRFLDLAAYLVRNWMWTLLGIIVFLLLIKIVGKMRGRE